MAVKAPPAGAQVVPSLLAADLSRLGECLAQAGRAGVEWVSVDVMDGHFVPNLSFGPDFVRLVKKAGPFYVDAHLMVSNPEEVAPYFAEAGADVVTIHAEACREPARALERIRALGCGAGLAVKPKTAAAPILEALDVCDLALVMTVEPGFGGARFIEAMLPKIAELRRAIDAKGSACRLQVDGGINASTVTAAAAAGADSLVAGTAVFGAADIAAAFRLLQERARASYPGGRIS